MQPGGAGRRGRNIFYYCRNLSWILEKSAVVFFVINVVQLFRSGSLFMGMVSGKGLPEEKASVSYVYSSDGILSGMDVIEGERKKARSGYKQEKVRVICRGGPVKIGGVSYGRRRKEGKLDVFRKLYRGNGIYYGCFLYGYGCAGSAGLPNSR